MDKGGGDEMRQEMGKIYEAQQQNEKSGYLSRLEHTSPQTQEKIRKANLAKNVCDPLYKHLIEEMVQNHKGYQGESAHSALIVCNSDADKSEEMENYLDKRNVNAGNIQVALMRCLGRKNSQLCF
eukprot:403334930